MSSLSAARANSLLHLIENRSRDWALVGSFAAAGLVAVGIGGLVTVSLSRAIVLVYLVACLAALAYRGVFGVAVVLTATLPWLVVAGSFLPRLTETFGAGLVMILTLAVASPRRDRSREAFFLRLGIVCFCAPIVISLGRPGSREQLIEAAKYLVFPAMVVAVSEGRRHLGLARLRWAALWSSVVAVTLNLCVGFAGYNFTTHNRGSYGAGEILGYASEHDLALVAACVTAATIATATSWRWAPAAAAAAIATVATGVRSTLPGLAVLVLAKMVSAGARIRTIVLVGLAVTAVFASGAANVIEARFQSGAARGEFRSFSALGSGRGEIYSVAVDRWRASSPLDWLVGTGLRSIPKFEQEELGSPLVGHSDLVQVGVELGVIGLFGLILIWWRLIASAESKAPLLILGSFALFNGALEYVAPLVIALLLSSRVERHRVPADERAESRLPHALDPAPSAQL